MDDVVFKRIRRVAADIFNLCEAEITPKLSPETVENWDSIQHLNFVLAVESEFGIQFSPEEVADLLNLEAAVLVVEEKSGFSV
jgi:acyl carrier protein